MHRSWYGRAEREPSATDLGDAILALFAEAARERVLVTIFDDAQWLDHLTVDALSHAFRGASNCRIGIVMASHGHLESLRTGAADETEYLAGLHPEAARALLLDRLDVDIADHVATSVIAATNGLPLALLDLCEELTVEQWSGAVPLPDPLPVGRKLTQAYRSRLARLPATCRTALVVLASANAASDLLAASFAHLGIDGRALDPAEDAGIVTTNGPVVQFCDPLVGSVVLAVASPQQRRAAHAALAVAASDDPERHADHMAAAAFGPSEEVAAALSIAATEAQRRGGANAAAAALEKAALFTPAGSERVHRLVRAAKALILAGQPRAAVRHLNQVIATSAEQAVRQEAALLRRHALRWTWADEPSTRASHVHTTNAVNPCDAAPAWDRVYAATRLLARGQISRALDEAKAASQLASASAEALSVRMVLLCALGTR